MKFTSLIWPVLATLFIAMYCWINRYEMSPISDKAGSSAKSVRLDRWTGEMCMVHFDGFRAEYPEAVVCWP